MYSPTVHKSEHFGARFPGNLKGQLIKLEESAGWAPLSLMPMFLRSGLIFPQNKARGLPAQFPEKRVVSILSFILSASDWDTEGGLQSSG